nr:hypothetical protein [Abalone asfa-like virus]
MPIVIAVEGPRGAGKTDLIEELVTQCLETESPYTVIPFPHPECKAAESLSQFLEKNLRYQCTHIDEYDVLMIENLEFTTDKVLEADHTHIIFLEHYLFTYEAYRKWLVDVLFHIFPEPIPSQQPDGFDIVDVDFTFVMERDPELLEDFDDGRAKKGDPNLDTTRYFKHLMNCFKTTIPPSHDKGLQPDSYLYTLGKDCNFPLHFDKPGYLIDG